MTSKENEERRTKAMKTRHSTHSSEPQGKTQKDYFLRAWQVNVGNWNGTNAKKRQVQAYLYQAEHYNLHPVICNTIGQL